MRSLRSALLATLVAAVAWATAAGPAHAATVVIDAVDTSGNQWQPPNVTINVGDTVRWEFDQAAVEHTVTNQSSNWSIDETRAPNGEAVSRTFDTPGVYTFYCRFHSAMTGSVTVEEAEPTLEKVLVFSKTAGFRHDSIPAGIQMFQQLGAANGFDVTATEDSTQFTEANLAQYDVVVFLSTTSDVLNDEQQAAFENYIRSGGGYVGIHAATDTEYTWSWYGQMLGGYFRNHPAGTPQATVRVEDDDEPSTIGVPAAWTRNDEWYNFQNPSFPVVNGGGDDYSPRSAGVKVLMTVDESTYDEDDGNSTDDDHPVTWCTDFDGGRAWYTALGHTQASYTDPTFRTMVLGGLKTAARTVAADCGAPRQAAPTADDFEITTLDDDTESPMELAVAKDGRVLYVERITGEVNLIKANGDVVTAGRIPVSSVQENGLLGIALDPDFDTNGHFYVSYTPLPNSSTETRVSRFTLTGDTFDLSSERVIFTFNNQRTECCHSSGSLAFDKDGNLYLSTGDNTNPFASDGFAPLDERPGREFWDAQRTAANTNSYSGKILRIKPLPNPTGPGIGTGYTIPPGNMFDESQDTENKTLPEIFAMGFRNPFRITVDPISGQVLMGDYGPDASSTNPDRGPQGSVEFNIVTPGFYGWPYCVRDNVPYNDYDFATGQSGAKFNCAAPVNDSPNNTGLRNLPPAKPAVAWMGYTERDLRNPGLGTGGAPTGGPRYSYDPDLDSDTKFPAFYDKQWFIGEWNNGWIKTATLNDSSTAITNISSTPWQSTFRRIHEMEFGPDGSLYVIDWGSGFNGNNLDSGIYRIDYVQGQRKPIAHASADPDSGPVPLTVKFSSAGSIDPEGTSLTYEWDFDGDGTTDSTEANPTHTYTEKGNYNVRLTVTDADGQTGVDTVVVVAGNTRPEVKLEIPEDGQFANFGDTVPYKITVTDAEDDTIDCDDVSLNIQLGHDEHAHSLQTKQGCEGTFTTLTDSGHDASMNIFTSVVASYTDKGSGVAQPLTGIDDVVLHTRRKRAEHFAGTGRVEGSTAGGDPGVQKEPTQDADGGNNIGYIENGDYVYFNRVNFKDINRIAFRVASAGAGGKIELRADSPTAETFASVDVAPTGGWQTWTTVSTPLTEAPAGTHTLYIVFTHPTDQGSLMNLNWFEVTGKGASVSAPPEVTATATPDSGPAPLTVHFDATASDPEGTDLTYEWDFGVSGTTEDTSTEEDPTYTYRNAGTYTARVTVTDESGIRSSATVTVRVSAPPNQCDQNAKSDEFNGTALDLNRWSVKRSANNFQVRNGRLELPIDNGSIYQTGTSAVNIITQPVPTSGEWTVTAAVEVEKLTQDYQQAGMRVYSDDDNWASVHMISAGGIRQFEFIYEANGNPRNEAADHGPALPENAPLAYFVRIHSDGTNLTAQYSFDGEEWTTVGRPAPLSTFTNPGIGPVALSDSAPEKPMSYFDWIRFDPDTGGGGGGSTVTDDFDGTELGSAWEVVRQDQGLSVSGGALHIPAAQGDVYGATNTAKNLVLRTAPTGVWTATTKLSFKGTAQYHQAGIILRGDDDNLVKFGRIAHQNTGAEKFEFIQEINGEPRNEAPDSTGDLPADFPNDFWLRMKSNGTTVTGEYSTDGSNWTPVGRPAAIPANAKVGMFAFNNAAETAPVADFDFFTLEVPGGPAGPSRDDDFSGDSLDKSRWNAIVREDPSAYTVSGGQLTITLQPGDIYTADTNPPPNNFILQSADHAGADWVIETKVDTSELKDGYAQGGLIAYGDGDNYVKLDAISDAGQTRFNRIELRSEVNATITDPQPQFDQVPEGTAVVWLRLTKTGTTYKGEYSFDGNAWTEFPTVSNAMTSPAFGLFAFAPQTTAVGEYVSFDYFTLDGPDAPGGCDCTGPGDEFDGTSLDTSKFNAIVRPDDSKLTVEGGQLKIKTVAGDIYTNGDPSGTRNFILQTADHIGSEDYVLETAVDVRELNGGYAQGGIIVYTDDDNYVKFDPLSDEGQSQVNRIELRSEVNGTITNPQPQANVPAGTTKVWLRLTKTGTTYVGEYSFDGEQWTALSDPVTHPQTNARFGLYTLGVNNTDERLVAFDYLKVNGSTGCAPQEPENTPPVITAASATPQSGFAPLDVKFDVTATDEDGDNLSYRWDFGDGGTSTSEDPTHRYTEAGTYEAEVTVSDGTDERTRTVTVTVFGPDDPQARFRALVFSRTTGFRHDSIPAGIAAIKRLGEDHGFQVDATEDPSIFNDDALAHYQVVVFLSTTGDPLNDTQQAAFERYIRAGGGYVGIHAAADTEYTWTWYGKLVGAYFRNHPAGTPEADVLVEDRDHHSTQGLPARWHRTDEWYNYQRPEGAVVGGGGDDWSPREAGVHVLATLDESTYGEDDGNDIDDDHPISWCQRYDGGRSWYTGMGHTQATFSEPLFLDHLLGGLEVAAGVVPDDDCGNGPANHAPTVSAQRNPGGDVQPGDPVAFTAQGDDADGDTLTYSWDFGDGGTADTKDAMHTYTELGVYFAKVTVKDGKGGVATAVLKVTVTPLAGDNTQEVGVGGVVPGVLALEIAGSANFGTFVPSVNRDYLASVAATATSSATAAELTVRDPSAQSTGHLVNGGRALAQPVQVRATDEGNPDTAYAPVPEDGSRLRLLSFPAPFSAHPLTIGFKQSIAASEPLVTGGYGKVLVFTLSATTP